MQFLKNELNKKPHVKRGKLHLGGKKTKECFFWEVICQYFFHWQKTYIKELKELNFDEKIWREIIS